MEKSNLAQVLLSTLCERINILYDDGNGYSWRGIAHLMEIKSKEHGGDPEYVLSYSQIHRLSKGLRNEEPPPERVLIKRLDALGVQVPEILRKLTPEEAGIILAYVEENREDYTTLARAIMKEGRFKKRLHNFLKELKEEMDEE